MYLLDADIISETRMVDERDPDWSAATCEGSRRALLRQPLKLTVRERLKRSTNLPK